MAVSMVIEFSMSNITYIIFSRRFPLMFIYLLLYLFVLGFVVLLLLFIGIC